MDNTEKRTGIQISQKPADTEISTTGGGIKIAASEKPISSSFVVNLGRIYVLLDCSGSMKGSKLDQAKMGILDFTRDAFKKDYQVGLIKFSSKAEQLCEPTNDIGILQNAMNKLKASGSTNMTAAIKAAHAQFKDFTGSRVMVIATDGMPDSVKSSLEAATNAKAEGIEIITVGTDDADIEFLKKLASRNELGNKVSSDMFSKAISATSLLLTSPKSITPK
jgi:uncharacterized protein with von Willebrand factor type A (vWA) domain